MYVLCNLMSWLPAYLAVDWRWSLLGVKVDLTRARRYTIVGSEVTEIASGGRDYTKTDLVQYTILALAFNELPISRADISVITAFERIMPAPQTVFVQVHTVSYSCDLCDTQELIVTCKR